MKNENLEIKSEKNRSHRYQAIGMSMGMCFGISIGMLIGMAVGIAKDKRINEQIEEKGYTILEINQKDDIQDEYIVKIVDKDGQESIVVVSKGKAY